MPTRHWARAWPISLLPASSSNTASPPPPSPSAGAANSTRWFRSCSAPALTGGRRPRRRPPAAPVGWTGSLNKVFEIVLGSGLPEALTTAPLVAEGYSLGFGGNGYINLPAVLLVFLCC